MQNDELQAKLREVAPDERQTLSRTESELKSALAAYEAAMGRPAGEAEALLMANSLKSKTIDAAVAQAVGRPSYRTSTVSDADGGVFGYHLTKELPAIWGQGEQAYMTEGELCIMYGGDGTGKTTLTHNLLAGLMGLDGFGTLLGQTVHPLTGTAQVLYLAFDRPRQIERSWSRFITPQDADNLSDRIIWRTESLPFNAARDPLEVAEWIAEAYPLVTMVILDNVWDAFGDFNNTDNATQAGIALNNVARSNVNVLALHHDRKTKGNKPPESHENMYGGRNFAAKAGSIIGVWKAAQNDGTTVTVTQYKEASEKIPAATYMVTPASGRYVSLSGGGLSVAEFLRAAVSWCDLTTVAKADNGTDTPDRPQKESTRRLLTKLVQGGEVETRKQGDGKATQWRWIAE